MAICCTDQGLGRGGGGRGGGGGRAGGGMRGGGIRSAGTVRTSGPGMRVIRSTGPGVHHQVFHPSFGRRRLLLGNWWWGGGGGWGWPWYWGGYPYQYCDGQMVWGTDGLLYCVPWGQLPQYLDNSAIPWQLPSGVPSQVPTQITVTKSVQAPTTREAKETQPAVGFLPRHR